MAEPAYADELGGHTWRVEYDGDLHVAGCGDGCHDVSSGAAEDLLIDEAEDEMALIWDDVDENGDIDTAGDTGLLVDLKTLLIQIAVLEESNSAVDDDDVMWPLDIAGAVWNFNMMREDRSKALHNFTYATQLFEYPH